MKNNLSMLMGKKKINTTKLSEETGISKCNLRTVSRKEL